MRYDNIHKKLNYNSGADDKQNNYNAGGLHFLELQGCSLAFPEVDDDTFVLELIFTYRCLNQCSYCNINNHIPYSVSRVMSIQRAMKAVNDGIALTRKANKKHMRIQIIGREPFTCFDKIKEFYDNVMELQADCSISVGISTCGYAVTSDVKEWLRNTDIRLALRWKEETKDRVWQKNPDFWKCKAEVIVWNVSVDNFSFITEEVDFLYKCGIPVLMELCKIELLTKTKLQEYFNEIKKPLLDKARTMRFAIRGYKGCETKDKRIITIDTDGEKYICQYMSPLRQIPSVYEAWYSMDRKEECQKCAAYSLCGICPAAAALKNNKQCSILQKQSIYISKIENHPYFKNNMD